MIVDAKEFKVSSGYGYNTQEPFVEIEFESVQIQVTPENARDMGLSLLRAAEAAYSDAFLVEFLKSVGGNANEAAALLVEFRAWREQKQAW
jgi:hypothetical protein